MMAGPVDEPPPDDDDDPDDGGLDPLAPVSFLLLEQEATKTIAVPAATAAINGLRRFIRISISLCLTRAHVRRDILLAKVGKGLSSAAARTGVERVPDRIAEQVERQHREQQRDARHQHDPRVALVPVLV